MSASEGKSFLFPIVVALAMISVFGISAFVLYKYTSPSATQLPIIQNPQDPVPTQPVACTQEAKQCPDGSFVSRTEANCEFAACPDESATWQAYTNTEYGFEMKFPASWAGYSVVPGKWTGNLIDSTTKFQGPLITFRNQKLATDNKFQGIPIMVFTPDVWKLVQEEKIAVSAAPIGPAMVGQNTKYFFATPPRWYGFADNLDQNNIAEILKIVNTFKGF